MGRSTRSKWAPLYVRGLLSSDGPKSVQPIAIRLGLPSHDQLHHFVSSAAWNDGPLWRVLAEKADSLLGGDDAVLVVDDTALPKKGPASVGVTGQYSQAAEPPANPARLMVFFDETWTTTNMARLRGRSPRGTRLLAAVPHGHWHTSTFLAGLRIDRMVALLVLDGAINGDAFPVYVQQFLAPSLTVGDIVIADNLASHKVAGIREVGCLECSDPSRSGSDREDLRHVEAQLRATSNAMARSRRAAAQVRFTAIAYNLKRSLNILAA